MPLFECRNLHRYICACIFPCVPMNTIRRRLAESSDNYVHEGHNNGDVETTAAAIGSLVCVDAPCLAGAMVFNRHAQHWLRDFSRKLVGCCCGPHDDVEDEDDDEDEDENDEGWERNNENEGVWKKRWQSLVHSKVARAMSVAACVIYPMLICPTTCYLRSRAIERAEVDTESSCATAEISCCCWPCALVQVEDELHGDAYQARGLRRSLISTTSAPMISRMDI